MAAKSPENPYLPADTVASEILPRLPPRTLMRFKCVSKFFYHYISSKNFINLHLRHSVSSTSDGFLTVFRAVRDEQRCLYVLDLDFPDSHARHLPLPPPFSVKNQTLLIIGSCHGLLCLMTCQCHIDSDAAHYIVLNPSTGKFSPSISPCYPIRIPRVTYRGFGYDRMNDDYKLVLVNHSYNLEHTKVRIYGMKSRCWRLLETNTSLRDFPVDINCVLIDNHLMHWLFEDPVSTRRRIACFNLEKEQWAVDVALPDYLAFASGFTGGVALGVVDGGLCLLANDEGDEFCGWIMKEYGVKQSWTKFSLQVPHASHPPVLPVEKGAGEGFFLPISLGCKGRRCIEETYGWYNFRDQTSKKLQLIGAPYSLKLQSVCLKSLVTDFGDCQSVQCNNKVDNQVKLYGALV